MKKKTLSLALALVMCLGLTVPAMAAESVRVTCSNPYGPEGYDVDIVFMNVLESQNEKFFTCSAPAEVKTEYDFAGDVGIQVTKVPDGAGLTAENFGKYFAENFLGYYENLDWNAIMSQKNVTLTEPGSYMLVVFVPGGSFPFVVNVQADNGSGSGNTTPPAAPAAADPTNDALTADGVLQTPTVYKINGSNYFKIRDLAAILNGTNKQFSVGYDGALKSVTATTGVGYEKQPGDLAGAPAGGRKDAVPSNDAIYINGEKVAAEVYKIDGSNYFKLRDLGEALDFYVGWSKEAGVFIQIDKPYSE